MKLEYRTATVDDGAEIAYVDVGEGRFLFYVDGFGGSVATANGIIERFSKRGAFRTVAFDQRGYGQTPFASDFGVERSAADLRALIERLDARDVCLVGYSMGGSVLFSYLEQFGTDRVAKAVFVDTCPKLLNDDAWRLGYCQGRYFADDYDRDMQILRADPPLFKTTFFARCEVASNPDDPPTWPEPFDRDAWLAKAVEITGVRESLAKRVFFAPIPPERAAVDRRYWESMTTADFRASLGKIDVPTLVLHADPGSLYRVETAEYIAAQIPGARRIALADATHVFPAKRSDEFVAAVAEFCR